MSKLTIDIQGHSCLISFESPGDWHTGAMGRANYVNGNILISSECGEDFKRSTLLHEIVHIISGMNDLELSETQVSVLGIALFDIIKSNPKLVGYLTNT